MRIIPVLDLMGGVVVHGRGGRRQDYRPIETPLGRAEDAAGLARALVAAAGGGTLYVADLDAIEGRPLQAGLLGAIAGEVGAGELWVDAGFRDAGDARLATAGMRPVFGSESLAAAPAAWPDGAILSLDFAAASFRGPRALLDDADSWPADIIVMTLAAVGSDRGPELERVAEVRARAGGRRVFAAGGVRGPADVDALARVGCAGVLVASALHGGRFARPTTDGPQ